jgi:GNAT superfamily N-acetyltransferase
MALPDRDHFPSVQRRRGFLQIFLHWTNSGALGPGSLITGSMTENIDFLGLLVRTLLDGGFCRFFFAAFFESIPLDMMRTPLTRDVRSGIHLSLGSRCFIIARFAHRQSGPMPSTQYTRLDEPLWPLMNKFYRAHQSSMKAVRDAQLWVARRDEIVGHCAAAGVRRALADGLFVDPACREQGIAAALIAAAVKDAESRSGCSATRTCAVFMSIAALPSIHRCPMP